MVILIYLRQIVIVNLSAFVLTGSHLVLFKTKAESILGTADFAAAQVATQHFLPQRTLRKSTKDTKEVAAQPQVCHGGTQHRKETKLCVLCEI